MSLQEEFVEFFRRIGIPENADVSVETVIWVLIFLLPLLATLSLLISRKREARSRKKMIAHLNWRPEGKTVRGRKRGKAYR